MTYSMTAFARKESMISVGKLAFEIRSVNHRYLDLNFRLSDVLRELEPDFREIFKKKLSRGKIDISARLEFSAMNIESEINHDLAKSLIGLHHKLYDMSPEIAPIDFLQLLKWPGMLVQKDLNIEDIKSEVFTALEACLDTFISARVREGNALNETIKQRLVSCQEYVAIIHERYPEQAKLEKTKLEEKLKDISTELDPARIEQEMVILAQKLDLAEEIDRLNTHINEFKRILNKEGQAGRRMDFLLQEMNREANTMASKAIDAKIQHMVVEIKVLLEQIREQVQNIE